MGGWDRRHGEAGGAAATGVEVGVGGGTTGVGCSKAATTIAPVPVSLIEHMGKGTMLLVLAWPMVTLI